MTRTTLDIDASVLRELKYRQRQERKTLGQLVSELLANALAKSTKSAVQRPFRWKTAKMTARIDLEDKDALMAALGEQ